ncbi:hypothetical protein BKA62DRAFT_650537 [Auriculariales sp. MPI-PUGE-AT-0066]|nr:hypothetical protein BKA62DRAFT_650537 [Auriculariales sp. MPI-PUGE-AT-0066]
MSSVEQQADIDERRTRYSQGREYTLDEHDDPWRDDDVHQSEALGLNSDSQGIHLGSHYALTRQEIAQNIANRFVHSQAYIFLYLAMAALSITTVVFSLLVKSGECPKLAFYVLEFIVNSAMILEVGVRLIAFGRKFWQSIWNCVDLGLTLFCAITLLVLTLSGCGSTSSREEEILDTVLLFVRNILQFVRLAAVMRKSGRSIFSRPRPIDLNDAQGRGLSLDIDMPDEEFLDRMEREHLTEAR